MRLHIFTLLVFVSCGAATGIPVPGHQFVDAGADSHKTEVSTTSALCTNLGIMCVYVRDAGLGTQWVCQEQALTQGSACSFLTAQGTQWVVCCPGDITPQTCVRTEDSGLLCDDAP